MRIFMISLTLKTNGDVVVSLPQKDRAAVISAYNEIVKGTTFTDRRAIKRLKRLYAKDFSKLSKSQHCWLVTKLSDPICAQLGDDLTDIAPTKDIGESVKFAQIHLGSGKAYVREMMDYYLSNWTDLDITESRFKEATGRSPQEDDLERCNCKYQGALGHYMCGWNYEREHPKFW